MGYLYFNGIDRIEADMGDLSNLSEDDKWDVIKPGAILLRSKIRDTIDSKFGTDGTGDLRKSITVFRRKKSGSVYALIAPKGKHRGSGRGIRKRKGKGGILEAPREYSGTNADVAYYLEHGTPRIRASHFFETATEEAEEDVYWAISDAWDEKMNEMGL